MEEERAFLQELFDITDEAFIKEALRRGYENSKKLLKGRLKQDYSQENYDRLCKQYGVAITKHDD